MSEINGRANAGPTDAARQVEQAREAARTRALEDERRKSVAVHVDPQKQLQTAPAQPAKPEVHALDAHKEAGRLEDSARKFAVAQAVAMQGPSQPPAAPTQKVDGSHEAVSVAEFARRRDPQIRG